MALGGRVSESVHFNSVTSGKHYHVHEKVMEIEKFAESHFVDYSPWTFTNFAPE